MSRKLFLIALITMCLLPVHVGYAEEWINMENDYVSRTANSTDKPIISGALNPFVGEEYTYYIINFDKVDNLSVKLYPAQRTLHTDSFGEEFYSYGYSERDAIVINLDSFGSFSYIFQDEGYVLKVTYTKNGVSDSTSLSIGTISSSDKVAEAVRRITEECIQSGASSDYEKALWLHDYLVEHAYYSSGIHGHEAYGVLIDGYGVCDSYSKAYELLLEAVNIPNHRQRGIVDGIGHSWNVVQLDDKWYHIDVTYDDSDAPVGSENRLKEHYYFGLTDELISMERDYDIAYPCTSLDANYLLKNGFPASYSQTIDPIIIQEAAQGAQNITCSASYYYTKYEDEFNCSYTFDSSDIVYSLLAIIKSKQAWVGPNGSTVYYDFTFDAENDKFIGVKTGVPDANSYNITLNWNTWPVYAGQQVTVFYQLNQQIDPHQKVYYTTSQGRVELTEQTGSFNVTVSNIPLLEIEVFVDGTPIENRLYAVPLQNPNTVLTLPDDIEIIEENAFDGIHAEYVIIPNCCKTIKSNAFANNPSLRMVVIPSSVQSIATNAFDGCAFDSLFLMVEADSNADRTLQGYYNLIKGNGSYVDFRD